MALFSNTFSFEAPSSRPSNLYTLEASSISPTSSRAGSPASPTTTAPSSVESSTDDLFALASHLSASSLYPPSRPLNASGPGRRSPPRSTPFTLPPSCGSTSFQAPAVDLLARRERRQAYVQDQLSSSSKRKLSLLVARMMGDDPSISGSRKHPHDGLHPSNVRVVPPMPGLGSARGSRRNTLVEMKGSDEEDVDMSGDDVVESIEQGESTGAGAASPREREASNRISKRRSGERSRKSVSRVKR